MSYTTEELKSKIFEGIDNLLGRSNWVVPAEAKHILRQQRRFWDENPDSLSKLTDMVNSSEYSQDEANT
jgi:hypothetical protein